MAVTSMIITLLVATLPGYQLMLDQFLVERDIPGISAVVTHRDSVLLSGGSGLADLEAGRRMTAQAAGRGIGLRVSKLNDRAVARHDGWFAAHRSHLLLDPEAAIGTAVLANSDDAAPALLAEALVAATLGLETDSR